MLSWKDALKMVIGLTQRLIVARIRGKMKSESERASED